MLTRKKIVAVCVTAITLTSLTAHAAPFVPKNENEVVDQLPGNVGKAAGSASVRESRRAQVALNQNRKNLDLALHVAQLNIRRARTESEPRYLGQAEAALTPWLNLSPPTRPPVAVLVLRASS